MFYIKHIISDSLVSCILDTQIAVFNMFTNMWSPYIVKDCDLSLQEEPLDLSMKTQKEAGPGKKPVVRNQGINFDFLKFYQTYYQISSRSWPACPGDYGLVQPIQTSNTRKRKISSNSIASEDSESGNDKKIRLESVTDKNESDYSHKKEKSGRDREMATIKDCCDCRFCYEDHIIKMRLKTERPWITSLA